MIAAAIIGLFTSWCWWSVVRVVRTARALLGASRLR